MAETRCQHDNLKCIDSRPHDQYRRRRYRCKDCGHRFSTIEVPVEDAGKGSLEEKLKAKYSLLTVRQQSALEDLIYSFIEKEV